MRMRLVMAAILLLLAGCGETEDRQASLTQDEEQRLNDAAAMLDEPGENAVEPENENSND